MGPIASTWEGGGFVVLLFLEKRHSFENVLHLLLGYPRGSITSALCPRDTPWKGAELRALGMAMGAHR